MGGVICPECGRQRGAAPGNCRSLTDCLAAVRKELAEWRTVTVGPAKPKEAK